jgi:hypothetical protein
MNWREMRERERAGDYLNFATPRRRAGMCDHRFPVYHNLQGSFLSRITTTAKARCTAYRSIFNEYAVWITI